MNSYAILYLIVDCSKWNSRQKKTRMNYNLCFCRATAQLNNQCHCSRKITVSSHTHSESTVSNTGNKLKTLKKKMEKFMIDSNLIHATENIPKLIYVRRNRNNFFFERKKTVDMLNNGHFVFNIFLSSVLLNQKYVTKYFPYSFSITNLVINIISYRMTYGLGP